ncbi:FecR domain-containing protein [Sphingobacterium sp. DN00404]|uniref:FecR domain-containing protein n=1 Tax=Sphingobacterium micropteri TaxID=2763501 RepID=A0ABR7YT70_9SPHI|nr:FecR family protein [Sphingobacterium micropteri]MBD1434368.1 FecR domain-containing protein [Sphingobacterium micropteri]
MIYKKKYVKELIRKQIKGILTPREAGELDACRRLYAHEEIQEMIADVLLSMEEDERPVISTGGWKPDIAAIIRTAEQRSRGKRPIWRKLGWAAAVLIPVVTLLTYWYATRREQIPDFLHGPCAGLTTDADVPLTESVVSLRWGDTAEMQVAGGKHGEVLQTADVQVLKTKDGVFQLRESANVMKRTGSERAITVATGAQQQAMVELPDGTRIRLNAQSSLQYAPEKQKAQQIKVQGEAYVQRPDKMKAVPLLIGTSNGVVKSNYGDFALLSLDNLTRAATLKGELSLHTGDSEEKVSLDCYGAQGSIWTYAISPGVFKDTLRYEATTDTKAVLAWTKAVRTYKDVPLREFVAQMSLWYGFQVKDYSCLPADRRITTTVCYRKDREAAFAAIREAGVLLYESKGMISFCPEEAKLLKNVGTMLAWWE